MHRVGLGYAIVNVWLLCEDLILWEIFGEARVFNFQGLEVLFFFASIENIRHICLSCT